MKITCGTDIIEIARVKESIENVGTKFIERVYTEKEIEYCESRKKQKYHSFLPRQTGRKDMDRRTFLRSLQADQRLRPRLYFQKRDRRHRRSR